MGEEEEVLRAWSSLYVLRVVWALKLKGIEHEEIYEDLTKKSPSLLQYNPVHKKIPVLVHNGKPHLDLSKAMARFWVRFGEDKLFVLQSISFGVLLTQGKEQEEVIHVAEQTLKYLEEELKGKKFFGGEKIGIVDLALGWLAYYLEIYEEISGAKLINQQKFPLLTAWMQEFSDIPTIQESWPPRDKLIAKFTAAREASLSKGKLKWGYNKLSSAL
uniref:glutathione transferase n=1 Tax=Manihot esculenta TaxID=3983 RepID=A0A2C9V573_MANES